MPVINGVYLKDFPALPSAVTDANIIPIAISGNQIAYRTTVAGIVTDARVTSKLLTGLSVTGSTILATDTILQAFGKVQNQLNGKVSSVGLTMPSAFNVANSPITSAGTLAVTAAGVASQYIRGDGALADFPTTGGGGSSVSYYLNGSVSQGTIGGNAYYEMNKTPVIGTGTDFTINANGYIAQFITDANDPASLLIPAGNWNVEMYFSASSNGGSPSFYVEVYKYNGTTFTLLGSSATTPEGITNGTAIDIYYTSVGIPETVLTITDRLAIRVYVTHSGRTITLHTEDNHLSEIVTTFSNGLTTLNGLTKQSQYFATGTTGTDFNISSSVDTHTFNIPSASATNRGLITTGTQTIAGDKTLTGALNGTSAAFSGAISASAITITTSAGIAADFTNNSTFYETLRARNNGSGNIAAFRNLTTEVATISNAGNITANSFVKTGGTSSQFLKADGSVDSTAYGTGSVTSVAALTLGTSGTDLSSTVANGTTTPVITLNVPNASATARGVVTTGTQTFAGAKTFNNGISASNSIGNTIASTCSATGGLAFYGQSSGGSGAQFDSGASGEAALVAKHTSSGPLQYWMTTSGVVATMSNAGGLTLAGQLSLGSTITNGTYTYTLPSATGTLALTSALSDYLPLAGGTLTGAISGTSATFSGAGTFKGAISGGTGVGTEIQYTSGSGYVQAYDRDNSIFKPIYLRGNPIILEGGNVLIGTTTDAGYKLDVNGTGRFSGTVTFSSLGTGTVYSNSGTLTNTNPSDRNLKTDITDLHYGLNEIMQLRPVSYLWKDDKINQGKQFGFIAQEVRDIMPDLVKEGDYLGLDKEAIFVTLINAIKELNAKITKLENK